jgi:hypothetical protein
MQWPFVPEHKSKPQQRFVLTEFDFKESNDGSVQVVDRLVVLVWPMLEWVSLLCFVVMNLCWLQVVLMS